MEKSFTDHFDCFMYERIQGTVVSAREDERYKPLWEAQIKQSAGYQELIKEWPEDHQQISAKYHNALFACHDYEETIIYLAGFRDCVQLLKTIGIL